MIPANDSFNPWIQAGALIILPLKYSSGYSPKDQTLADALSPLGGGPCVHPAHSRLQREPGVVDLGRTVEVVAVEVLELPFGSIRLLRYRPAGQQETTRREQDRHEDRRDAERPMARSAAFHCHHVLSLSM